MYPTRDKRLLEGAGLSSALFDLAFTSARTYERAVTDGNPKDDTKSQSAPLKPAGPGASGIPRWVSFGLAGSGWIAALLLGLLELPAKINSFYKERDEASQHLADAAFLNEELSGSWMTGQPEGKVIAIPAAADEVMQEGAPIHLSMRVYRGAVEGVIVSEGLRKRHIFSMAELEGKEDGGAVGGVAWDVISGKRVNLATFLLTPSEVAGEPVLRFKVVQQGMRYFPETAILRRTRVPPEGEYGEVFKRAMESITD